MTLQIYMWVSWTSTLDYIDYNSKAHNSDMAEMTHDMTRHDKAGMFMLVVVSMSSCSVAEWWMCSWCIIASSPRGKVCEVFDGHGVHLMFAHACSSFVCTLTCFMCSPVCEKISLHEFLVHPFMKQSPCMNSLFVCLRTNLLACAILVHLVRRHIMSHPCTCI